jgi:hypothetical protein
MVLSDQHTGGALRAARQAYAGPSAQIEAQRLGRTIVTARNFDPEDVVTRVGRMSGDEQDSFVLGVAQSIADQTEAGRVAQFARAMRHNRRLQQRLQAALGPDRFNTLAQVTERSARMLENTNRITGNSATANRQQNIRDATTGENEWAQLAADVLTGRAREGVARRAGQWWLRTRMPGIRDPRVSEALANRLTQQASPPNVRALIDDMAGLDQLRGANPQPLPGQPVRVYGAIGGQQPRRLTRP